MRRVRDLFPLLNQVPAAAGADLTLDSPVADLQRLGEDRPALDRFVQALVAHVADHEEQRLGRVLPGLAAVEGEPVDSRLRTNRSRNALSRAGIKTWGQLAELTARDLRLLPSVGALTVGDIISRCVEVCIVGPTPASDASPATALDREPRHVRQALATLRAVATWAARERHATRIGDLWELNRDGGTLPRSIAELWSDFRELAPEALAEADLLDATLGDLVSELLAVLEPNHRSVYEQRVLNPRQATLEEVGQGMGISRERVRQIQVKAEDRISAEMNSRRFWPIQWRADDLRSVLGLAALADSEETTNALDWCLRDVDDEKRDLVTRVLLHLAGPYRLRDGWLELVDAPTVDPDGLLRLADEYGLLQVAEAHRWLSAQGVDPAFHDAWIARSGRFRRIDDLLAVWSGSLVDKCVTLLALRGQPTDAETLVAEVGEGHNARGARNRFFSDPRLVRVNRSQWALREWGIEEYTGITEEISQRIVAAGGRAALDVLVNEISEQFGVKPGSVKVYAEAPMFVVENGWVRLRKDDEPFPIQGDISTCRGVYASAVERLSMLVPVDKDTLRGSGRSCPPAVAKALGVEPGRPRSWHWAHGELVVTWPRSAAFGPSIGSARAMVTSVGAVEGDVVRLDFDLSSGEVSCTLVPRETDALGARGALEVLTGLELADTDDLLERVGQALQVPTGEVRRRLVERGDSSVAALLPAREVDASLEAALAELSDLLDDLQ